MDLMVASTISLSTFVFITRCQIRRVHWNDYYTNPIYRQRNATVGL